MDDRIQHNAKMDIIERFNNNVKGVNICLDKSNTKHCGREGHWLETMMGVKPNSKNEPDINGYEMKKQSDKTTLGDFSASEYAFSKKNSRDIINKLNKWTDDIQLSRSEFIRIFGSPNPKKNNRYSWSGRCVPKFYKWNYNGQILLITKSNYIFIYYSFIHDKRIEKSSIPSFLQNGCVIAIWDPSKMVNHINQKFNKYGFFICKKNDYTYDKICFGKPFNFEYFIECIKSGKIIFDSGMYEGNTRNYSQFRGTSFWDELIIEEY